MPNKLTECLVSSFCDTESVHYRNHCGQVMVISDDSLAEIHQTLLRSRWKSLRKLFLHSVLYYNIVHKTIKTLKIHPYCANVMQELKEPDEEQWLQYCTWLTHFILCKVFESNKVWFHLSGYINSQNSRICNAENPNTVPFMKGHYTH